MLTELSFLDGLSLWAFMFAESPRDLNFTGNPKEETSVKNTSTVGQARDQTKKTTPPFLHNASLLGDIFSPQTLKDVRTRRGENHLIMFTQIVQLASYLAKQYTAYPYWLYLCCFSLQFSLLTFPIIDGIIFMSVSLHQVHVISVWALLLLFLDE